MNNRSDERRKFCQYLSGKYSTAQKYHVFKIFIFDFVFSNWTIHTVPQLLIVENARCDWPTDVLEGMDLHSFEPINMLIVRAILRRLEHIWSMSRSIVVNHQLSIVEFNTVRDEQIFSYLISIDESQRIKHSMIE